MIGIFDSGLGGLSVLIELKKKAPELDIVYFGDIKRSPYGDRNDAELGALTALGFEKLLSHGADKIVTACNSVSILLMRSMLDILGIEHAHVIEMVNPTVRHCQTLGLKKVLLLATQATVQSGMYQRGLEFVGVEASAVPLSGLVDLIDGGAPSEDIENHIDESKEKILRHDFDVIILGCTHFPLVKEAFQKILGEDTVFIDPAVPVVQDTIKAFGTSGGGSLEFLISKDSEAFRIATEKYFGSDQYTITITK